MSQILEDYTEKLYKYCLTLTHNKWDAEDLVQETLIKCFIAQRKSEREINLTYLYTTARNHFIDGKRKKSEVLIDGVETMTGSTLIPEWDSLIEILLSKLPLRQAMMLTLKDVFQFSSKEIAQMLRVSNESVKTALHRIRLNLKDQETSLNTRSEDPVISIRNLAASIKDEDPYKIFYYYRLLESENCKVLCKKNDEGIVFFVSDPDGNLLQIGSK